MAKDKAGMINTPPYNSKPNRMRSADVFWRCVASQTLAQTAEHRDQLGRTALHWAVYHLALSYGGDWSVMAQGPMDTPAAYSDLIVKLLQIGADPLAQDASESRKTPFITGLENMMANPKSFITRSWTRAAGEFVNDWGRALLHGGIVLHEYVRGENEPKIPSRGSGKGSVGWTFAYDADVQLVLLEDPCSISARISKPKALYIWEYRPPPGSLPVPSCLPLKVCWKPDVHDGELFWSKSDRVALKGVTHDIGAVHFDISNTQERISDEVATTAALMKRSQDDHSIVNRMMQQYRINQRSDHSRRSRSSSQPALQRSGPQELQSYEHCAHITDHVDTWPPKYHKCPLDSKWTFGCRRKGLYEFDLRSCMKGLRDSWEGYEDHCLYTWEFRESWEMPVAEPVERFMKRFRPAQFTECEERWRKERPYLDLRTVVDEERGRRL